MRNLNQRPRGSEGGGYSGNNSSRPPVLFDKKILSEGIKEINLCREWGHFLAEGNEKVKTTQIRKFFGAVKKIQADFDQSKSEIVLLNPKLAYAVGRNKNSKVKDLYIVLSPLIDEIGEDKDRFKNFVNIFEAIVAYHKEISGE